MKQFIYMCLVASASGLATPTAEAEAVADAIPEAQDMYDGGYGFPSYSRPNYGLGSPSNCSMVNNCCGAADQGCCMEGGQKCYTKYERMCSNANQPKCRTKIRTECINIGNKQCRNVQTPHMVRIPRLQCKKTQSRKCWNYEARVCDMVPGTHQETITWKEQSLEELEPKVEDKCFPVTSCQIVNMTRPVVTKVPERKCEDYPRTRTVCRTQQIPQQPVEQSKTVWDVVYKQVCYNVPKPVCTTVGCSTTGCPDTAQPCQLNSYNTETVCPQAPAGSSLCGQPNCPQPACQQVQTPSCQAPSAPCYSGSQQCCTMKTEQVCQQVPQRVPRVVKSLYTPAPRFEKVCDPVTETQKVCRTVMVPQTRDVPYSKCQIATDRRCFPINLPQSIVKEEDRDKELSFPTNNCTYRMEERQHCALVDTDVQCNTMPETKRITISRRVCDQQTSQRKCLDIPYSWCEQVPGQTCEMVPRQVCQDTCSQTSSCNQCSSFISGGGYSSCTTNQCNNYYPATAIPYSGMPSMSSDPMPGFSSDPMPSYSSDPMPTYSSNPSTWETMES